MVARPHVVVNHYFASYAKSLGLGCKNLALAIARPCVRANFPT